MRDMLDAAWGDFPTNDIGYDWARYTGNARPTAAWCAAVAQHSRITFIQETDSQRSKAGFAAGADDCRYAEARAREVHRGVESLAVVVSDGNGADNWDASEYGRGWASAATLAFFPYGAVPICESFIRGAGASPLNLRVTWVPETWGKGTGLSQVVGASPVANTDLNHVWAPYYPTATPPTPTPTSEELPAMYVIANPANINDKYLVGVKEFRHIDTVEEFNTLIGARPLGCGMPHIKTPTQAWFDSVKKYA